MSVEPIIVAFDCGLAHAHARYCEALSNPLSDYQVTAPIFHGFLAWFAEVGKPVFVYWDLRENL
jgi:hypothetical protein